MTEVDVAPSELSDRLIGRGRHFISTAEVAEIYGISPTSVPASLERAREAGKLISVTKGGWVPVPAEYRSAGAPGDRRRVRLRTASHVPCGSQIPGTFTRRRRR